MRRTQPHPLHAVLAGLCASLVGIGLARFAYTPLVPALIDAHWFGANEVFCLGAANLVGYLVGAFCGRPLARLLSAKRNLRWMMLLVAASFFACAIPLSIVWFFAWRFVSGLAGGVIMVLAAGAVLPYLSGARKGLASGAIFLGLGLGIAASGTLVPLLLGLGLRQTWMGLGMIALLLTALSWSGWPSITLTDAPITSDKNPRTSELGLVYVQYALMAVALVPTMIFLVDYIARGIGWGTHAAATFWVVYGLGAIVGPVAYGALADRIGLAASNRTALMGQLLAIMVLVLSSQTMFLLLAILVIGSFPPGIVPITFGRVQQQLTGDPVAQGAAWSRATIIFALFQALAGYAYSFLFANTHGNHVLLFCIGGAAIVLALLSEALWLAMQAFLRPATFD
ncbi:YbfB/YjiJ family MFS transporter [Pseudomonas moorei]|uniref:Predicted arabinose efflux permease, MFS family n=1 Tax=Pseudomonas moorei TaxID=395599 RepID=A0A1H1G2E5_9PSED|nr:YbfB/YjiJ family MFS transporter [Pseudomonas moorei]KAB0503140.1 YbfB/YjiJ family MFS transporter [Pseudomonas moorei]SDR07068.1 Predicted arabinose efflux permease, MFS family [Pseudomonas moorei]